MALLEPLERIRTAFPKLGLIENKLINRQARIGDKSEVPGIVRGARTKTVADHPVTGSVKPRDDVLGACCERIHGEFDAVCVVVCVQESRSGLWTWDPRNVDVYRFHHRRQKAFG